MPITNKNEFVAAAVAAQEELPVVRLNRTDLGPWSYSKYKSLKKCPFQFFLKYIVKMKVPETLQVQDDPLSAQVGKAAHQILEEILVGKSMDKAFASTKKEYVTTQKVMTKEQWEERIIPLTYNIQAFQDRIEAFGRVNPIKRVLTELRIGLTEKFEPAGFFADDTWLRGVIDLILLLDSGDAIIIDHKHGGGENGQGTKNYKEQLDWYKVMVHFGVQKLVGAQTSIHFIKAGEVKMGEYSPAAEIEGNLKVSLEMSVEGAVDILLATGFFKHIRGSYCKWCEYDNLGCKDGSLKPLELSTKKWIQIHNANLST